MAQWLGAGQRRSERCEFNPSWQSFTFPKRMTFKRWTLFLNLLHGFPNIYFQINIPKVFYTSLDSTEQSNLVFDKPKKIYLEDKKTKWDSRVPCDSLDQESAQKKILSEPGTHWNQLFGFRLGTRNPLEPIIHLKAGTRKPMEPKYYRLSWVPPGTLFFHSSVSEPLFKATAFKEELNYKTKRHSL